jgi:arylsulfatase A-like enzyme
MLCVSFSSNDLVGHLFGPDSQEVLDVTLRADRLVSDFLKFLDAEVGRDRYAVVVSADHGACPMPELDSTKAKYPAAQRVVPSELEKGLEAALTTWYGSEPTGPTKWVEHFDENVCPWVYLNEKAIAARKLKVEDVAAAARDWLAGRGFMEAAFTRQELESGSAKDKPFGTTAMLAYQRDRSGDVVAIPKAGVLPTRYKTGTTHGSPWPYDAHIPFLVYGAGVPALGKRPEKVSSLSVAPTLAWALGAPAPEKAALPRPEAIPTRK